MTDSYSLLGNKMLNILVQIKIAALFFLKFGFNNCYWNYLNCTQMNANESNLFRVFFSLAWFFRQIICMMLYSFHTSPFEALIDKKLTITDWDVMMSKFEKRDRQAIQVQKRKPNKIVWHLLNIVVYTNSKKKS